MSLFSMFLAPDHAEIVTDTLGYDYSGAPLGFYSKMAPLSHCQSVIVGRGPAALHAEIVKRLIASIMVDVDDAITCLPPLLRDVYDEYLDTVRLPGISNWDRGEVTAVGWSGRRKRIIAEQFNYDGTQMVKQTLPDGPSFAPHPRDPALGVDLEDLTFAAIMRAHRTELAKFRSPQTFIAMAKIQQIVSRKCLGHGISGDLVLCRLSRGEMAIRKIYRFADADDMVRELHGASLLESGSMIGERVTRSVVKETNDRLARVE